MATLIENLDLENVQIEGGKDVAKEVATALEEIDDGEDESKLFSHDLLNGTKPLRIKIKGTLASRGVNMKKSAFGPTHSIGVNLSHETVDKMNELLEILENLKKGGDDWAVNTLFFKGKWYPKLKLEDNKKRYKCSTVPKLNPQNPNDDLSRGMEVEIDTEVATWFSVSEKVKKCGLYFTFNKVKFIPDEDDEEAPKKKSKTKE